MRAMLLAAGYGTRLRPLTNKIPKCLVPIKGASLLSIWLQRLTEAGIGPFLINTHYLSEQVNDFVKSSPYQNQISIVHEDELLGTAGTLISNLPFFRNKDGLLIHADNYCLEDLTKFLDAHRNRPANCVMTMMTFRTETPSSCGIVEVDDNGIAIGFHEKVPNPPGNLANAAIYILSKEFFDVLRSEFMSVCDFSTEIIGGLLGKIYTFETKAPLVDIGTIEAYRKVNNVKEVMS